MAARTLPRIFTTTPTASPAHLWAEAQARAAGEAASETAGNREAPAGWRSGHVTMLGDMLTADRNSFGVMRLLFAMLVLISHSYFLVSGKGETEPLYAWTNYTLGQHGVQAFFILSGLLVAQSLFQSGSVKDYAIARALRIFPALIVCVLLTAIVLGPWLTTLPMFLYLKDAGVAAYIVKTISLWSGSAQLPGLFKDLPAAGYVNTSVWTLKYEVMCYLALAAGGFLVLRTKWKREIALALMSGWLALVLYRKTGLELHGGPKSTFDVFRYFALFFGTGVALYALRAYVPVHGVILLPLGAVLAATIGTAYAEPAMAAFIGYLVVWAATFRFGGLREFTNQNDYSYGTYIFGMPVSQALLMFFPGLNLFSLIMATIGFVLLLSFLSWEFVERPALRLRHRLSPRHGDAEAPLLAETVVAETGQHETVSRETVTASEPSALTKATAVVEPQHTRAKAPVADVAKVWRPTLPRLKVAQDKAAASEADVVLPEVPKNRLQFATKRPQAAAAKADAAPADAAPLPDVIETMAAMQQRVARPRPRWLRPTDAPRA